MGGICTKKQTITIDNLDKNIDKNQLNVKGNNFLVSVNPIKASPGLGFNNYLNIKKIKDKIENHYTTVSKLGEGSFGVVNLVEKKDTKM